MRLPAATVSIAAITIATFAGFMMFPSSTEAQQERTLQFANPVTLTVPGSPYKVLRVEDPENKVLCYVFPGNATLSCVKK
ncbi:MAG: hypothetical protein WAN46_07455 [Gammaproteobacteria bacterium]